MRFTLKPALILAAVCALALPAAWADPPTTMNVQGRLTDSAGDPVAPGLKVFTFKIFDAEVGGTEIWPAAAGEDQTLSTDADGLWNAAVGATIGLTAIVFEEDPRWLEVTVDDGINPAETLPRIELHTSPWAYGAGTAGTALFADHANTANDASTATHANTANAAQDAEMLEGHPASDFADATHMHTPADISPQGATSGLDADLLDGTELSTIQAEIDTDIASHSASSDHDVRYYQKPESDGRFVNVSGDVMSGPLYTPEVQLGNSGIDGRLGLWMGGAGLETIVAENSGGRGGSITLFDDIGSIIVELGPDPNQPGGFFSLMGHTGYLEVDGNYAGTGNPRWTLSGTQSTMVFSTNDIGDDAVQLPDNCIDTSEIKDEPGIASATSVTTVSLTSVMQDIETVTIDIPAGGYIVVEGQCTGRTSGTTGRVQGLVQIDETAGGGGGFPECVYFGLASHVTNATHNMFPVHVRRAYYKSSPASYTFRLEAMENVGNDFGANVSCVNGTLTATYYPTSYGSVATMVSAAEAGEFPSATPVTVDANPTDPDAPQGGEVLYEVDLRDLEIKAARANAEAERANRELMEARLNNGQLRPAANPEQ